jgi:hypothetical protein
VTFNIKLLTHEITDEWLLHRLLFLIFEFGKFIVPHFSEGGECCLSDFQGKEMRNFSLRGRTLGLFLVKAMVIYVLLAAPFSFYDSFYGEFFRACSRSFFDGFQGNGYLMLTKQEDKCITHVNVINRKQIRPDGSARSAGVDVNTRYLGYIPTILLISLVLASPVPWKRKFVALLIGLILVTYRSSLSNG